MSLEVEKLLKTLTGAGWSVELKHQPQIPNLGDEILTRYPEIPMVYLDFLSKVVRCTNKDQTAWFLCECDFNKQTDSAYEWDEFEKQSLDAANGDEDWKNEIVFFWDKHMPILLSVKSGYAYLALNFTNNGDEPVVVYGCEPEYEETLLICKSFSELVELILRVLNGESHKIISRIL